MKRRIKQFRVKTEEGRILQVVEYVEVVKAETLEGSLEDEGVKSYFTKDGTIKLYPTNATATEFTIPGPTEIKAKRF